MTPSQIFVESVCQNTDDWPISSYQSTSTMNPARIVNRKIATRTPTTTVDSHRRRRRGSEIVDIAPQPTSARGIARLQGLQRIVERLYRDDLHVAGVDALELRHVVRRREED